MSQAAELAEQIGDLLIRCSALTIEELADAVRVADRMSTTLGRTLEMNGQMSEKTVEGALNLRQRIDSGELSLDTAVRAMELIALQKVDVETALRQLRRPGAKGAVGDHSNKLGDLLSASGIISPPHLNKGLYDSLNTGLPLGMALVAKDVVAPAALKPLSSSND